MYELTRAFDTVTQKKLAAEAELTSAAALEESDRRRRLSLAADIMGSPARTLRRLSTMLSPTNAFGTLSRSLTFKANSPIAPGASEGASASGGGGNRYSTLSSSTCTTGALSMNISEEEEDISISSCESVA